jgi:hypothetical protein
MNVGIDNLAISSVLWRVVGENTNGGGNGGTAEFPVRDINR